MRRKAIVQALCLLFLGQVLQGCATQIKIKETMALPSQVKPGEEVLLHIRYTVSAPGKKQVKVKESRLLFFNERLLGEFPATVKVLKTASNTPPSLYPYRLPKDAAEGTYAVETTILLVEPEPGDKPIRARTKIFFVVGKVRRPPTR